MGDFQEFSEPYPSGVIKLWYGSASNIPAGWVYCDGMNGTPDLRDTYPKSVPDTATDPGTTGGQNSLSLSSAQMPSHNHTGQADSTGSHDHKLPGDAFDELDFNSSGEGRVAGSNVNARTSTNGAHTHTSPSSTDATGSGSTVNNEPLHSTAIFIQRV